MANNTEKKHGGRQKVTPNKLTKEIRTVLKDLIYKELDEIQEHVDSLEPKQRIELVIKLIRYVLPTVNSISHSTNEPLDWEI